MTATVVDDGGDAPGWRGSPAKRLQLALIAGLGAPLLGLLCRTLRVEVVGAEHLSGLDGASRPFILAVWHGRILPSIWFWRRRGMVVIISENFDGEWIARIVRRFGYGVARGSTSRGGSRALRALVKAATHAPTAFTVDGPRGPARVVQPGAVWLAKTTGHTLVPFHAEAARCWTLRSWDRTQIPMPFSRVVMAVGAPITVESDGGADALEAARLTLDSALRHAESACRQALGQDQAHR